MSNAINYTINTTGGYYDQYGNWIPTYQTWTDSGTGGANFPLVPNFPPNFTQVPYLPWRDGVDELKKLEDFMDKFDKLPVQPVPQPKRHTWKIINKGKLIV